MTKHAVYPGTFDPITNGHIDLIRRSLRFFDTVTIAVASNPQKAPLFSLEERLEMIRESVRDIDGVHAESFDGLLVEYARKRGAVAIVRGLRAVSDFEYEFQMALMNRRLDTDIETVFLMPSEEYSYLTSTIIKTVASLGGDVRGLVPPVIEERLKKLFLKTNR